MLVKARRSEAQEEEEEAARSTESWRVGSKPEAVSACRQADRARAAGKKGKGK